jgi:hypothetical protein
MQREDSRVPKTSGVYRVFTGVLRGKIKERGAKCSNVPKSLPQTSGVYRVFTGVLGGKTRERGANCPNVLPNPPKHPEFTGYSSGYAFFLSFEEHVIAMIQPVTPFVASSCGARGYQAGHAGESPAALGEESMGRV